MSTERPVVSSAVRIGACTFASRVTGLVRDMLLLQVFGVTWVNDAWNYAFQIPNLFRRLFGEGALAAAFVPGFSRTLEKDGKAAAWRQLAGTFSLLTVVLIGVIIAIQVVILTLWMNSSGDGGDMTLRRLTLALTSLMLPVMLGVCVLALFASVLNCLGSFVPAALAPIILNLFMIVGVLWVGPLVGGPAPERQVFGVAMCVLAASVAQLAYLIPVMKRHGVELGWRWAPDDPAVRHTVTLMGPVILGQGVLALGVFLDAQICLLFTATQSSGPTANWFGLIFDYPLREGALTSLTAASRLYQFPLGVIAVSLGAAALPTLSRLAAREEWGEWTTQLRTALRVALFAALLAAAGMLAAPRAIVALLYEYRAVTPENAARIARVLACYGAGLWAVFAHHIVIRAFYSIGDVRTPLKLSCALLPFNVALSVSLMWIDGVREAAFAISSAATGVVTVVVGLWLLRVRTGAAIVDRSAAFAFVRMLVACVCSIGAMRAVLPLLADLPIGVIPARAATVAGVLTLGAAVYFLAAWLLRLPEPRMLLRRH